MLKTFCVQFGESTDFSDYDQENLESRSKVQHYGDVDKVMNKVTKTGIQKAGLSLVFAILFYWLYLTLILFPLLP